ncbi:MAG: hypothetical protein EHM28_02860 [Spirochaetaceae bacterium]|nr:MAG: hypothetical protein EHM28_02860 [Spirochaetaceae bacterium]
MRVIMMALIFISAACGCTTENKSNLSPAEKNALPLKSTDEVLYDIKSGVAVGEVKFITNNETFAIVVNIAQASSRPQEGRASVTYYSFQGNFAGNYTSISGIFFIHAGPDANNLYIAIHDGNPLYGEVFRKHRPADEHCYLVSIMDQKTFIRVMDRRKEPFDPAGVLDTLTPSLVSQTIMRVRYTK